jgi:hypothetical protein
MLRTYRRHGMVNLEAVCLSHAGQLTAHHAHQTGSI